MSSGGGLRLTFASSKASPARTSENSSPTKRITRTRNKPKKYTDFLEITPSKHRVRKQSVSDEDDDEEDFDMDEAILQKPTALFDNNDVEGQDMFKFKSRHTKQDLHNKVQDAISNSPKVADSPMRTPRKYSQALNSPLNRKCEATPKYVKDVIKKRIIKEVESDSEESDFSGTSSDFVPDESEDETELPSSSEEESEEKKSTKVSITRNAGNKMKSKDTVFFVKPDNYFMMNSSKKITTSDHTLSRLKNLNIEDNEKEHTLSVEHKLKIAELNQTHQYLFNRWLYVLSQNFNVLLYGVGSKRMILQQFQLEKLKKFPCVVVNGYFPSLTIKNILESIIIDLLENTHVPTNVGDIVNLIDTQLTENGVHLFLIMHNIDGTMLRNTKTQDLLASLSQIKNVHTIASIDHINAPLIWDNSKLSRFNFTWWDVTTFRHYSEETSYENSIMTHRSGALQLSSLKSVYQSLTANAKGIINIIIQYQLENIKQVHYQGLPFKDLYSKCREQFLVSSDLALRAQLTEFLDHKLVKMKRTYDGSESLIIPIESALLQQFLEQQCN